MYMFVLSTFIGGGVLVLVMLRKNHSSLPTECETHSRAGFLTVQFEAIFKETRTARDSAQNHAHAHMCIVHVCVCMCGYVLKR